MLIGYGIAAAVVLVLLIVFNVRASRRPPQTETESTVPTGPDKQGTEPAESMEANEPVRAPKEAAMEDNGYRSALRQFQRRPEAGGGRAPVSAAKPSMSDTDYREALRKQQSGRKEQE